MSYNPIHFPPLRPFPVSSWYVPEFPAKSRNPWITNGLKYRIKTTEDRKRKKEFLDKGIGTTGEEKVFLRFWTSSPVGRVCPETGPQTQGTLDDVRSLCHARKDSVLSGTVSKEPFSWSGRSFQVTGPGAYDLSFNQSRFCVSAYSPEMRGTEATIRPTTVPRYSLFSNTSVKHNLRGEEKTKTTTLLPKPDDSRT